MGARFNPTHRCGHMGRGMPDTASSRAYAAEHVETADCWSCERLTANEHARSIADTLNLPELVAKSDRQAGYGLACRETLRQRIEELVTQAPSWEPYADAALYGITDAGWWIDRREQEPGTVLQWIAPVVDQVRTSLS